MSDEGARRYSDGFVRGFVIDEIASFSLKLREKFSKIIRNWS